MCVCEPVAVPAELAPARTSLGEDTVFRLAWPLLGHCPAKWQFTSHWASKQRVNLHSFECGQRREGKVCLPPPPLLGCPRPGYKERDAFPARES